MPLNLGSSLKYLVISILLTGQSGTKNFYYYDLCYIIISFICYYAFLTPFPRTSIFKGNANNRRNSPSCTFPPLMTHFPAIALINEESAGCTNEEALGPILEATISATIATRNPPSWFLCFTVLVAPSINRPESSRDFAILIIYSTTSYGSLSTYFSFKFI